MSNYYAVAPYSSELYHHGVKGQKWGVRRFQNPDGSLTKAGKRRAAKDAKEGIERSKDGEWRRTKQKHGRLDRSINASKKTRLANGKRLVEEGETVGTRLVKRFGRELINKAAGAAVGYGADLAVAAVAATGNIPLAVVMAGGKAAAGGYQIYDLWRNRVGAYQDIADISAYNQSRR